MKSEVVSDIGSLFHMAYMQHSYQEGAFTQSRTRHLVRSYPIYEGKYSGG